MHLIGTVTQLSSQGNDLSNDQFSNAARVAERGVEDSNAVVRSILDINLVCSDTEATHNYEISGLFQDTGSELSLRANANHVYIPSTFNSN